MRQLTLGGSSIKSEAQPFLKWAGGKSRLAPFIVSTVRAAQRNAPRGWRYFEPFLGGGAIFFSLTPKSASLSDLNEELVNAYLQVQANPEGLIRLLAAHQRRHSKAYYLRVRAIVPQEPLERAARVIYLNKTCFNGLWRVNMKGQFNVPMGSYESPVIVDPPRIRAASAALSTARILARDFRIALTNIDSGPKKGDFVYLDPPYDPVSKTSSFTSYTGLGFGDEEQRQLAELFGTLAKRGVHALLSNSHTVLMDELYPTSIYWREIVQVPRAINSVGGSRGKIEEIVVANFGPGTL